MPAAPAVPWFEGTAPFILAPAQTSDRALLIAADSLAADPDDGALSQSGTLIRMDGTLATVRVTLSSSSEGCVDAALDPAPTTAWGVGFVGKAPAVLQADSLQAIPRQDSVALATTVFRLASGVPNTPGGRFAGLPFTLRDLWRVRLPDGATVVIATTKRQINQEDSPLEERTLIVVEADSAGDFSLVHSARSSGIEETVEGVELLAAVHFPGRTDVQIILAHDFGEETSYSILERSGKRAWKARWSSRRFSC